MEKIFTASTASPMDLLRASHCILNISSADLPELKLESSVVFCAKMLGAALLQMAADLGRPEDTQRAQNASLVLHSARHESSGGRFPLKPSSNTAETYLTAYYRSPEYVRKCAAALLADRAEAALGRMSVHI